MARWGVQCSECGSVITHSEVGETLEEFLQPATPEVRETEKVQCPTCGKTVSYSRRDLRYFAK